MLTSRSIPLPSLLFALFALSFATLWGCEDTGSEPRKNGGSLCEASTPPGPTCGGEESLFYVLGAIDVARPTEAEGSEARGYDLDCRSDLACECREQKGNGECKDFTGPDGTKGIDNQFARLEAAIMSVLPISAEIKKNIGEGDLLILVELSNLDTKDISDATDDECVTVDILTGLVPGGGLPELDGDVLKPGQTFDIDSRSIEDMVPLVRVTATLTKGKLKAGPTTLPLTLPFGSENVELTIQDAQLTANVTATELSAGLLGGVLDVTETIGAVTKVEKYAEIDEVLEPLLTKFADMNPDDDNACTAVSAALTFEGIEAKKGKVTDPPPIMDGGLPDGGADAGSDAGN
ncbi:MAG: hypothetical protein KC416_03970 [Myxococcales bacterium]|nr:hypothetical protein [Myxococcales bacterium]